MSLTVALNTAVSGLFANQTAIAATSENIANVNTPDFARRTATFQTDAIPDQFAGVDVTITRAAVDRFLQRAAFDGGAAAAEARAISDALSRIEASLGAPGENLSYANALDDAFASLTALAANPSSVAARADALARLDAAFRAFGRTLDAIDLEAQSAQSRLGANVERVNALLADIQRLNSAAPSSAGAADLIDARLTELSKLVSIRVTRNDLGQATVAGADGTILASPGGFAVFSVSAGAPTTLSLSQITASSGAASPVSADAAAAFGAGEISGLLSLLNERLPALAALVSGRAQAIAGELNAAYAGNSLVGSTTPTGDSLIVATASGRLGVNSLLLADPARFAIARPQGGAPAGLNDGTGASALAFLSQSAAARNVASSVAEIGSSARNAELTATSASAFERELSARLASKSGVNLDEELSNLILYQRAYSANARIIAAVDQMWQTLLNTI